MVAPWKRGNKGDSITLRSFSLFLLVACAASAAAWPVRATGSQFSSGINVVEVYASVVDSKGQPVKGLAKEDFELLEDGAPQTLSAFVAGDFPLTVAVAVDRSFSMAGPPLTAAKAGARAFLAALRPADEAIVLGIASQVEVLAPATMSRAEQAATVSSVTAWGTTPLHDAVLAGVRAVDAARGRRALVILSDGDERDSRTSGTEVLQQVRRSNVMVYPIALGKDRPELFAELATLTGGRSYHARARNTVEQTMVSIAEQLREQYLLGYSPVRAPVAGANEWRAIKVRVKRPGVTVRARDGYFVK